MARVPFGYISEPQPLHRRFKRMMGVGFVPGPKLALGGLLVAVSLGLVFLPGIQAVKTMQLAFRHSATGDTGPGERVLASKKAGSRPRGDQCKTWRLADLKGKATLVDVWATVGSNSVARELPNLQRFYERIKVPKDVQMLTFNIDENPYQAERLLAEGKYSFPVIISRTLGESLFPAPALAQAWIIDAQGRRSSSFHSYRFVKPDLILSQMEKAAVAK